MTTGTTLGTTALVTSTLGGGTAVVTVVGAAMLAVVGLRLSVQAVRTRQRVPAEQAGIWEYYGYAGALALVFGGLQIVEVAAAIPLPVLEGVLLAFALLLALAMREAFYNAVLSNAEVDRLGQYRLRRAVEFGLVGVVVAVAIGPLLRPGRRFVALAALAAVGIVTYGVYFQYRRAQRAATRGTLIDALMRQSTPVLVFAGATLAAPALELGVVSSAAARAIAATFLVACTAALLTVTIKLGQHLAAQQ